MVIVNTQSGFKYGTVRYVGFTKFAPGEWIGVALKQPSGESVIIQALYISAVLGKNDGAVKGVRYFQCKDMHGIFVHHSKIIRNPGESRLSNFLPPYYYNYKYHI